MRASRHNETLSSGPQMTKKDLSDRKVACKSKSNTPAPHTKTSIFPLFFSNSDFNQSWFDKSHGSMINNGRKAVQTAEERHGLTLCWPWLA